eukprot:1315005-Pleurochrysis_carterae.AAC.2
MPSPRTLCSLLCTKAWRLRPKWCTAHAVPKLLLVPLVANALMGREGSIVDNERAPPAAATCARISDMFGWGLTR